MENNRNKKHTGLHNHMQTYILFAKKAGKKNDTVIQLRPPYVLEF